MPESIDRHRHLVIKARFIHHGVPPRDKWNELTESERRIAKNLLQKQGKDAFSESGNLQLSSRDSAREMLNEAAEAGIFISDELIATLIERVKSKEQGRRVSGDLTLSIDRGYSGRGTGDTPKSWIRGGPGGPGRETARKLLDKLCSYTPINRALDDEGPRGTAVRRAIQRAGTAADDLQDEGVNRYEHPNHQVLAHQINAAYHEADLLAAQQSPVVWGVNWQVSSAHAIGERGPDVCDVLAGLDLHGLGRGIYFPGSCPSLPHIGCQCSIIPQTVPAASLGDIEYSDDQVPNRWPHEVSEDEAARVMQEKLEDKDGEVTAAKVEQATELANRELQVAHDKFIDF